MSLRATECPNSSSERQKKINRNKGIKGVTKRYISFICQEVSMDRFALHFALESSRGRYHLCQIVGNRLKFFSSAWGQICAIQTDSSCGRK